MRREYAEYLRDAGYDAHDQRFGPLTVIMGVSRFVAVHVPGSLLQAVLRLGSARGAQNHCEYIFDCQFKLVHCLLTCLNLLSGNVCSGFVLNAEMFFQNFVLFIPSLGPFIGMVVACCRCVRTARRVSSTLAPDSQIRVADVEAQADVGDRSRPWMGGLFDFHMGMRVPEQTTTGVEPSPT